MAEDICSGFRVAMRTAPAYAAHGADGFVADDAKWDELWNAVCDVCREDGRKTKSMKEEQRNRRPAAPVNQILVAGYWNKMATLQMPTT